MSKPAAVPEIETNLAPQGSAVARARAAVEALRERGVVALVTGSLAEGRFREGSDIDLLVTECPRILKYAIEGLVEDCLMGYPFDVIYLQEIPLSKRESFLGKARDVSDIS
jgi:predicted nucleotidyltransferase